MTDRHPGDSRLDAAIDRAVREMMGAEPRADLRERVLAELTVEPARAAWWPRLALLSAAVAVAVVVLLMIVSRPPERPVGQTSAGAAPPAAAPRDAGETVKSPGATPPVHVDGPRTGTAARRPVVRDRPVQAASVDTGESIAVEPMTPLERLTPINPIGITRLEAPTVSETSIKPIRIERIAITPLTPPR